LTVGFRDASWNEFKSLIVLADTIAKFGQNPNLKGKLLATGDRLLAEAASRDRVWGIGYTANRIGSIGGRIGWGRHLWRLENICGRKMRSDDNVLMEHQSFV
jgi:predicted NAD-dependent protein-ADP-ribosyltransferase YbiA (DUF1768 family)